ncbi:MAG: hypothetical protein HAW67_08385 [Endozoicomonadaceae bacterium]|nr:hypothetical protein [Endozoicomonadaceae bacterium]
MTETTNIKLTPNDTKIEQIGEVFNTIHDHNDMQKMKCINFLLGLLINQEAKQITALIEPMLERHGLCIYQHPKYTTTCQIPIVLKEDQQAADMPKYVISDLFMQDYSPEGYNNAIIYTESSKTISLTRNIRIREYGIIDELYYCDDDDFAKHFDEALKDKILPYLKGELTPNEDGEIE